MCDFTEMTPYIAELRAMREHVDSTLARNEREPLSSATATATAAPPCGADHPLDRAVAGDPLLEQVS